MTKPLGKSPENGTVEDWRTAIGSTITVDFTLIHSADLADSSGTPLKSDRSQLAIADDPSVWEYGKCPYTNSPSRTQQDSSELDAKPMSFFEQRRLVENFRDVLGVTRYMRESMFGEVVGDDLSFYDSRDLMSAIKFSLHYLVFRAETPIDADRLPTGLIVAHNTALGGLAGLNIAFAARYRGKDVPEKPPTPPIDEILQTTEASGSLVGRKTVCAASPARIKNFFSAAISGHSLETAEIPDWFESAINQQEISALVDFGRAMESSELADRVIRAIDKISEGKIQNEFDKDETEDLDLAEILAAFERFFDRTLSSIKKLEQNHITINSALGRTAIGIDESWRLLQTNTPYLARELYRINPLLIPANHRDMVGQDDFLKQKP